MAASRRLRDLQAQPGNKICVDCSQKNPPWASVSYGVFMCLECFGKHCGLDVQICCVRSVPMDSWSEIQIKKMEAIGSDKLNAFFAQYGIAKETDIAMETDIVAKYNTNAASVYRFGEVEIDRRRDDGGDPHPPPPTCHMSSSYWSTSVKGANRARAVTWRVHVSLQNMPNWVNSASILTLGDLNGIGINKYPNWMKCRSWEGKWNFL
ncbi:hypothetical protein Tsubulata_039522 [Turnera subulata]|uniref:Arf-GAP domain-containing protein n=1 Tax=Turnera subulata TaxID=218843 RepID=A0A9Q0G6Y2_9ROSI|nr:hypothetical protein Tsubulata_039522 [Turnera subulata]